MLLQLFYVIVLTILVVFLHLVLSHSVLKSLSSGPETRFRTLYRLMRIIISMLLVHFAEAALFALFYARHEAFDDIATAMYFSLVSYATVGYGDVLLPVSLRLVGASEGLVGTLMVGWSVALLVKCLQVTKVLNE